eukprot:TRINITY_DN27975_c0_g1_i1.p1 TRINITY_DN27975_c0_g1~~TRINITY_DN27975_c0_g1_i1.p1  ORF type:complete len:440 (-),score=86.64 TRINITY_DN27975_c0_g1_i1:130-1407(-)
MSDYRESSYAGKSVLRALLQLFLFAMLLVSNVGQRLAFKDMGYALGPYPYFVLVSISAAFVPIFGTICLGIICFTGGFLPETRTWKCMGSFFVIGCGNALQGLGMVFANPHVPGYLQALLQQSIIPFTLGASSLLLRSRFTPRQYSGVLLITVGIAVQLVPSMSEQSQAGGSSSAGTARVWSLVFLLAQFPVALAAIFQEKAFQSVPVNVFHMLFWASVFQFSTLVLLAPLDAIPGIGDTSSPAGFVQNFAEAWRRVANEGAAVPLCACVVTMLLAQLAQALMVKYSSAAFCVLCMAFVVPTSAVAFTVPAIAGAYVERLGSTTPLALLLVFVGVVLYRLGTDAVLASSASGDALSEPVCAPVTPQRLTPLLAGCDPPDSAKDARGQPRICTAGVGIIQSEYSNAKASAVSIFEERTLRERNDSK